MEGIPLSPPAFHHSVLQPGKDLCPGNGTGTDDKSYRAAAVHALCLNVSDSVAYQPHRNNKHNTLDVPGLTGAKRNLTHLCLAF